MYVKMNIHTHTRNKFKHLVCTQNEHNFASDTFLYKLRFSTCESLQTNASFNANWWRNQRSKTITRELATLQNRLLNSDRDDQVHDLRFFDDLVQPHTQTFEKNVHTIIVNTKLPDYLPNILKHSKRVVCADGASNRLYDMYKRNRGVPIGACHTHTHTRICDPTYIPEMIVGDLDSIKSDVKNIYDNCGVPIIHKPSQDSTDLMKCWEAIKSHITPTDTVLVVGGIGGRLDQTACNIHILYDMLKDAPFTQTYMTGEKSLCFLLTRGTHRIILPNIFTDKVCGLLPFGAPSRNVVTKGLRWNLTGQTLQMTSFLSSSNEALGNTVEVSVDDPIVWYSQIVEDE